MSILWKCSADELPVVCQNTYRQRNHTILLLLGLRSRNILLTSILLSRMTVNKAPSLPSVIQYVCVFCLGNVSDPIH
jgi:hypothetical protein